MPENWDMKNKVVLGDRAQAEDDNDRLSAMRLKLKDTFKELTYNHKKVTAALLKEAYCRSIGQENEDGDDEEAQVAADKHTLLETVDDFIIEFQKLTNSGERSKETLKHWYSTRRKVHTFLNSIFKKKTYYFRK